LFQRIHLISPLAGAMPFFAFDDSPLRNHRSDNAFAVRGMSSMRELKGLAQW
jgi:hypothetical protein